MKKTCSKGKLSWPLLILLAAVCTLFPARSFGQSSNRWLLIFETTSSMRHRTNGVLAETEDLLKSGMHGFIHTGDTIGIWTFNDRLPDSAPLQTWSPEASAKITRRTLQFLSAQQYAKSARMDEMLTNLLNIVQSSPFITVILFTDGDDPIKGTPFDAQINEVYKASYRQQKKASMPVMTVLRGVAGEITTNTVNMAPWPAAIPPVPPPPPTRTKPHAAAAKPSLPAVPPLIYIGKKPESTSPPQSGEENNAMPTAPSNTNETNGVGPRTEAPAPSSASAPPESPVASPATPSVEPTASEPTAVAGAPAISQSVAANEPAETQKNSNSESAPGANVATASAPPQDLFSARNIAIVSVAFAVIVCGLLVMAARRARASQASLITRSLDRERR